MEVNKIQHSNIDEFLGKVRKHIFSAMNAAYTIGSKILGLKYDTKIDDELLDKFCIDKVENLNMTVKILEKYEDLYKSH